MLLHTCQIGWEIKKQQRQTESRSSKDLDQKKLSQTAGESIILIQPFFENNLTSSK